jgi:hypothetical protein
MENLGKRTSGLHERTYLRYYRDVDSNGLVYAQVYFGITKLQVYYSNDKGDNQGLLPP